jgi:hypothetical protein
MAYNKRLPPKRRTKNRIHTKVGTQCVVTNTNIQRPEIVTMAALPNYGSHMTVEQFVEHVKTGWLTNYDGFGYYASATQESNIQVVPSDVAFGLDKRFTHVVWYNK